MRGLARKVARSQALIGSQHEGNAGHHPRLRQTAGDQTAIRLAAAIRE
jgi:hypothetical protein